MSYFDREQAIKDYGEEVVMKAESLEYGDIKVNLVLCDIIDDAYYGNWSIATDKFKNMDIWGAEYDDFLEALEENGDSESIMIASRIGFYSRVK